jgi:hypothetical protein
LWLGIEAGVFGYFRGGTKGLVGKRSRAAVHWCRDWQYWIPILIKLIFVVVLHSSVEFC